MFSLCMGLAMPGRKATYLFRLHLAVHNRLLPQLPGPRFPAALLSPQLRP